MGAGDGTVEVDARCRSPRVDLALRGEGGRGRAPRCARCRSRRRETSVDPFLRAVYPALPAAVGLVARAGTCACPGRSTPPRRPRGRRLALRACEVLLPEYPVRNRDPLRFVVDHGTLDVRDLHLAGEGTDLAVEGRAGGRGRRAPWT